MIRIAAAQPVDTAPDNTLAKGLAASGVALGAGLGGYKYLRRFQGSNVPALRALQDRLKNTGVDVVTHQPVDRKGSLLRRALYGAKDVSNAAHAAHDAGASINHGRGVLHHSADTRLPISGTVNINAPGSAAHAFGDKGTFGQIMQANAPAGSVPKTHSFSQMRQDSWDASKRRLDEEFGEGAWMLKPREGSLGNVADFPTGAWDSKHQTVQNAMQSPGSFIAQEKIPIQSEYRVHTVNGVPLTATNRYAKPGVLRDLWDKASKKMGLGAGGFAHVPVRGEEKQQLHDFVNKVHAPFQADPAFYRDNPMHIAYDVAKLPDGSFRLIEANPTPGTLNNPGISRKVIEAMTGRKHQDIAAAQALGGGLAAGGLGYAGLSALEGSGTKK